MVDRLTKDKRSWLMSRVKSRDTLPEIKVRKAAHALGLRFQLHRRNLPGTPDLIFPRWKSAIFVHGCFWHRHRGCKKATTPKSKEQFWGEKFDRNIVRDEHALRALEILGWRVLVIWQCETGNSSSLREILVQFFNLES